ncbi:PAS domain-containing sensor histidine kinase [uncultured Pontibacter sp.]|uniref:sensor histidine kinase n=1 Tax=uncultured Pontibacter sp. TaxID=453356 RepID=UPI002619B1B4|nr:PAS domain-containing sensor histidine kinase [uncultured Pontibacter sp.]
MPQPSTLPAPTNSDTASIFSGGGEMGALMRSFDWESHPMGNPQQWPHSLRANIRLLLNSRFPIFIWWTKDLFLFHNDAYLPALGKKHPTALGAKAKDIWAEVWDQIGGLTEDILENSNDFYAENLLLYLERNGYAEETYWTFSYSPAFNDAGEVAGIFCACNEETSFVLGQRRLKTLKDISDALSQALTMDELSSTACAILNKNPNDLPFNLIYLTNAIGSEARLTAQAGQLQPSLTPDLINLLNLPEPWPLAEVQQTRQPIIIDLPAGSNSITNNTTTAIAKRAVILPILRPAQIQPLGFFIAGLSDRLEYNENYQGFHSLLAGHIATSIINVQARQEILNKQEYLNEIFQQAPVGITMLRGPEYIVDIANPAVCEIWRIKQEDVLGRPVLQAIPEATEQGFKLLLDEVLKTGVPFVANELPLVLERNGELETVYLNFVYHPLRDEHGFISGIIAVAIDISEQVKARQEIETMNRQLLTTNADLDNFVYSASHDLKAPIYNIEGLMHELQEHLPPQLASSIEIQQLTAHIQTSINRFKKVVTELTEVAKIQREAGEDTSAIDLKEVITGVCLDLRAAIVSAGAIIETNLTQQAAISFSAKNIRSIVYNLISNAIKYKSPERKPHILISTEQTADYLALSVADNGLGLNPDDVQKMFSMFKRLHDHVEGSGIGLYIVKKIVDNAGGKIEVESELGKGTTFRVFFSKEV